MELYYVGHTSWIIKNLTRFLFMIDNLPVPFILALIQKPKTRAPLWCTRLKDTVFSLLWLGSLLWCRFDPWPGNFPMPQGGKKKKKKKKRHTKNLKTQNSGFEILVYFLFPFSISPSSVDKLWIFYLINYFYYYPPVNYNR